MPGEHREQRNPREEKMLRHPKLVVEQVSRDEGDRNKRRVIRVQHGRENNLLEAVVEVAAKKENFLPNVHRVV